MSNLFASLQVAGSSLRAYSEAITATQNNLVNATTPGYARQIPVMQSLPFQPRQGLIGGLQMAGVSSSRQEFAEAGVRTNTSLLNYDQQMTRLLDTPMLLLDTFGADSSFGLSASFNNWFDALRGWRTSPWDTVSRQQFLDGTSQLASSFRDTADAVEQARQQAADELKTSVLKVNRLLTDLESLQQELIRAGGSDAGLEASFYAALEELAGYMDIRLRKDTSGVFHISTSGGSVLLSSDQSWPLTLSLEEPSPEAPHPAAPPRPRLTAADGTELTSADTSGRMGALLEGLNTIYPSLLGDTDQPGDLNRLAQQFAERVNGIFTTAQLSDSDATPGLPLFEYNSGDPLAVARTLAVNPNIDTANLALASTAPSLDPMGVPAQLLRLSTDTSAPSGIQPDGVSYTSYLDNIGRQLGTMREQAGRVASFHGQLLEQSRVIRERVSGVSLEEEAVSLIQLQRSFESIARLISVLDEMTQTTLNLGS